jgi:hypothetical protein
MFEETAPFTKEQYKDLLKMIPPSGMCVVAYASTPNESILAKWMRKEHVYRSGKTDTSREV